MLERCRDLARAYNEIAGRLAHAHGFYGVNVNAVFEKKNSAVSDFSLLAPYMHNLTTIYGNEPPLYTDVTVSFDIQDDDKKSKWRAPADVDDVHPQSEFLNIYSSSVRTLAVAQCSLCIILDELRLTGLHDSEALLQEEFVYAECGLKVARCCVYLPQSIRITLLLLIGRCMAEMSRVGTFTLEEVVAPLEAGLKIGMANLHPSESMMKILLQLVDCYADGQLKSSANTADSNLKVAMGYLCSAVNLGSKRDALKTKFMTDDSFDQPVPEGLASLLKAYGFSSGVLPAVFGAPVEEPDAGKGGKGGKGAPAAGSGPPGMTGRDLVSLLTSLMRESSPLRLTDPIYSIRADIHKGLKDNFPRYATEMTSSDILDAEAPVVIAAGSVSTLWLPAKMPTFDPELPEGDPEGIFTGYDGYFVLGTVDPEATDESLAAITKVRATLKDVVAIERRLKELAWTLKIAMEKKAKVENRMVATGCAAVLEEIALALVPTLKGELAFEASIDEETQAITLTCTKGEESCSIPGDMATIVGLADTFSPDFATNQLVNADLCRFLRVVLGYPSQ